MHEDRAKAAVEFRRFGEVARRFQFEKIADRMLENAESHVKDQPGSAEFYRFDMYPRKEKLLIDHCWMSQWGEPGPDGPFAEARHTYRLDGQLWTITTQPTRQMRPAPGEAPFSFGTSDTHNGEPEIQAALGGGFPVQHPLGVKGAFDAELSKYAELTHVVPWHELIQFLDGKTASDKTAPTPLGSKDLPMLEVTSKPWKDTGKGLYRLRVWFDAPGDGGRIVAAESAYLQLGPAEGRHYYLQTAVLEWSEPVSLKECEVFRKCAYRPSCFVPVLLDKKPDPADPLKSVDRSYYHTEYVFEFSKLSLGQLDADDD
jgi:hypothetical protein